MQIHLEIASCKSKTKCGNWDSVPARSRPKGQLWILLLEKMYPFVFFTIFFLFAEKFGSASTPCRVRTNRFLDRQLVGHVIAMHQSLDAEDCMDQCVESQQCYSTNFHLDSRRCELNDRTRLSHPMHLIRASHVIHEDNPARDYVPCSDALCNKLEVCRVTKGRPKCSGKRCIMCYVLVCIPICPLAFYHNSAVSRFLIGWCAVVNKSPHNGADAILTNQIARKL